MYTNNSNQIICEYCGDTAKIIKKIKEAYWPFKVKSISAYCYECYQEIVKGQIPKVTDSSFQSRKGNHIKKRRRLITDD